MQTMLHVWPRLRLIQEERQALGIAGSLPDLDRLTAFAALMPVATVGNDGQIRLSVEALRPNPARYPPPGYAEEQAPEGLQAGRTADVGETSAGFPILTESELLAARLLGRTRADGYVQPLSVGQLPAGDTLSGDGAPARSGVFRLGRELAPELARSLVWEVIDATRLDSAQTNDPFVQTTIYIIASLAEPLTSALMWPILQEVITQLGRRQIARVIGVLATGSFAHGRSRLIEEAASHVALGELEARMGGASGARAGGADAKSAEAGGVDGRGADAGGVDAPGVQQIMGRGNGQAAERPGDRVAERAAEQPMFDVVYFLDREKSNQALASSPLELSVMAGNAIEALLAAGGAELMDQRMSRGGGASTACRYAILGAATDTVPVAESIAAAIAAEQKQALRAEVLDPGPQTEAASGSLADLGASLEEVLACALDTDAGGILEISTLGAPAAGLRIARDAWLPPATVAALRRAKTLEQWRSIAEQRLQAVRAELEKFERAAESAWGLRGTAQELQSSAPTPGTPSPGDESQAAREGDGLVQHAAAMAADKLAEDICREPRGIFLARTRVADWNRQVRAMRAGLEGQAAQARPDPLDGSQMARWQRSWAGLSADGVQSTDWTPGVAAGGLVLLASIALVGWFLSRVLPSPTTYQLAAVVIALVLAALGSGFVGWAVATRRVRGLKQRWQGLAYEHLNWRARRQQQLGLARVYGRLERDLAALQETLEGAIGELTRWTASDDEASEANRDDEVNGPAARQWTHLRRAHVSEQIWQETQALISQASEGNEKTRAALRRAWQAVDIDVDVDHSTAAPEGREDDRSRRVRAILRAQLAEEGILTGEKAARAGGLALAGVFRRYAASATDYLSPTRRLLVDYGDLVRQAARESSIEKSVLEDGDNPPLVFLEDLYGRAKPAASYEITSTFARDTGDVEFGVTPEGTHSQLERAAGQRGMPLLASHDPLSVSLVRITGQLALEDLALFERGRRLYRSLRQEDRDALDLADGAGG